MSAGTMNNLTGGRVYSHATRFTANVLEVQSAAETDGNDFIVKVPWTCFSFGLMLM